MSLNREKAWPGGTIGLVIGIVGSLILFRKVLTPDAAELIWGDNFDGNLMVWIFEWGYHVLFQNFDPLNFWHANSFYPYKNSLAFSDSILSGQVFYGPLRLLGLPVLPAIYVALSCFTILGCVLTDMALKRLGIKSISERFFVVFAAHFSLAVTGFLYHYQLFGFQIAPAFFLYLYLFTRSWQFRDLCMVCVLYIVGTCFATYLAPMLLVLSLTLAGPAIYRQLKANGWRTFLFERVGVKSIAAAGFAALILYFIQIRPYMLISGGGGGPTYGEAARFSAKISSLFKGFSIQSYWYAPSGYGFGDWERAYFPGIILAVTAVISITLYFLSRLKATRDIANPFALHESTSGYSTDSMARWMLLLFMMALVLSWGPYANSSKFPLPYKFFAEVIPPFKKLRAPGRFGMFFGLPLGLLFVFIVQRYVRNLKMRNVVIWLAAGLLVVESWPDHKVEKYEFPRRETYDELAKIIEEGTPLLELPVTGPDHFETLKTVMNQLKGSTIHWGKIPVGYGAGVTPQYDKLLYIDQQIKAGNYQVYAAVEFAKELKIPAILVHLEAIPENARAEWLAVVGNSSAIEKHQRLHESLLLFLRK